jgi:hypothetical protein
MGGLNQRLSIVGIGTAVVEIIGQAQGRDANCMEMTDAGPKGETDEDVESNCGGRIYDAIVQTRRIREWV